MVQASAVRQPKHAETEIAILQVQYTNIEDKVDELKTELKDLRVHLDAHAESTHALIRKFQSENKLAHDAVGTKIDNIEKWRWMIMGACVFAGAIGLPVLQKIISLIS
jgi:hypothetical protein